MKINCLKVIEVDETTTGVEMHKDSRFSQSWQNFKDSNPVMNKFVDYRSTTPPPKVHS